ncbi:hypothetical protein BG011_002284 [Mortierella polycephala]|uniref:NET domain-containing protein n=1 Tax=Mortierella polycephala TaxID=41804 RepID=A0A9P6Q7W6_9FUNG|nr:hypothetical protein BG011_002284 [Mortierella polycephala]
MLFNHPLHSHCHNSYSHNRITLADNPPDEPEGSLAFSTGPCNPSFLKDLALLNFANASPSAPINLDTTNLGASNTTVDGSATQANTTTGTVSSFSISDFLVPGLQTKVWEDWQGADDLSDYTAFGQDFTSDFNAAPFQFGLDGMIGNTPIWDNASIPTDQAYDEFVFDLAPSAFETPTTVNVADLIVGPNSMAGAASVSPSDLTMTPVSTYEDLALANLYGFTESSTAFDSDSGSDLDDAEDSEDDDESDEEEAQVESAEKQAEQTAAESASTQPSTPESLITVEATTAMVEDNQEIAPVVPMNKPEDPNKRRMEEALVARISNDLGPEHMTGLFAILKGDSSQMGEDEDEEMEVDLSCLDETTLVQVYQYVETCCMQTMGSILAAEERERAAKAAAQAAAEKEAMERERQYYASRTPELSPCHSSASSSSPSPPHPSSLPSPSKGRRSNGGKKKRNSGNTPPMAVYHEGYDIDQDAPWNASQATKSKRKRVSSANMTGVGGGGTSKGRRIQKDFHHYHQQQQQQQETVALQAADEDEMEYGEDAEIDIVGI